MSFAWSRGLAAALAIAACALSPATAPAQQAGVTFEFSYVLVQNRIEPNPMNNVTAQFRGAITLSGKNRVTGGVVRSQIGGGRGGGGMGQDVRVGEGQLGGRWRVVDASTLQATRDFPQSVLVTTIRTSGNTCTLQVEYRLKPGFAKHKFPLIGARGQLGTFDVIGVGQQTCTVVGSR